MILWWLLPLRFLRGSATFPLILFPWNGLEMFCFWSLPAFPSDQSEVAFLATLIALWWEFCRHALARSESSGKQLLRSVFLSPTIVPGIVVVLSCISSWSWLLFPPSRGYGKSSGRPFSFVVTPLPHVIRVCSWSLLWSKFDFLIEIALPGVWDVLREH